MFNTKQENKGASLVVQMVKSPPAMGVQSLGQEDSPGEGNCNPLQYSCLGNPMDRRAWRATVDGVTQSWTRLSTHRHILFEFSSVSQSCLTLCDPTDSSPPGCSVHGISQARLLQWAAISFSRGIFLTQGSNLQVLCLLLCQGVFFTSEPPGKP